MGALSAPPPALATGTVIEGKYEVLGPLFRGPFGDTYRAVNRKESPPGLPASPPPRARDLVGAHAPRRGDEPRPGIGPQEHRKDFQYLTSTRRGLSGHGRLHRPEPPGARRLALQGDRRRSLLAQGGGERHRPPLQRPRLRGGARRPSRRIDRRQRVREQGGTNPDSSTSVCRSRSPTRSPAWTSRIGPRWRPRCSTSPTGPMANPTSTRWGRSSPSW